MNSPIIGGMATSPSDPLGRSTVQIMSFQKHQQRDGREHVQMTSTCTGTIIAPNLILTAAHCILRQAQHTFVYFSTQIPLSYEDLLINASSNSRLRKVVNRAVPANWKPAGKDFESPWFDVGLLKIEGTIPATAAIAMMLPAQSALNANETILTAGFGITNPVTQEDSGNLQQVLLTIANPQFKTGEFLIHSTRDLGVCQGDSGGAAYVRRGGRWFIAGVASHPVLKPGTAPEICHVSTIFTNISFFSNWIQSTALVLQNSTKSGMIVH